MRKLWKRVQRRLLPPLVAWVGQGIMHLVMLTCRIRFEGLEHLHHTASKKRCILMLWHNRIVIVTHFLLRKARQFYYAAVISNSRDGDMLDAVARTYRHGRAIRVPHNARHRAVKDIVKHLKEGIVVIITPDGPAGPRYHVKAGVAFTAKATQATILPFSWSASSFWQLPGWDKMMIPKPFSKVVISVGEGIDLSDDHRDVSDIAVTLKEKLLNLDHVTCQLITQDSNQWPR